ncbi:MAG: DUF123 domain-containing protein [Methanomicrobium sp.]|nr:DUF123 domain-containing protein [Methanomicrobium sp.]
MNKGIYFLVFSNESAQISTGSLGNIHFSEGWHIYAGSALGSGGLGRVIRHFNLSSDKDKKPHWHIDYLLLSESFHLLYALTAKTTQKLECEAAQRAGGECVLGFGCTDCGCTSHLFYRKYEPFAELQKIFLSLGLLPVQIFPEK